MRVRHLAPMLSSVVTLGALILSPRSVAAAQTPLEPVASAQDLAATIPGATLFLIPGLAHDLPPQLAPLFAAAVPAMPSALPHGRRAARAPNDAAN